MGRSVARRVSRHATPILLLLPAAVILCWLMMYPIGDAVRLSLTNWEGFAAPEWIGVENFQNLVQDKRFTSALGHNLIILLSMPLWIAFPYAIAWGLYSQIWGWRFFRFAFFLPVVLAPVVVGVYYGVVLRPGGPFNEALGAIGLDGLARPWLNEPDLALPIVIAIVIWSTFGIGALVFLSAFANLDYEQIDAARIDGATPLQIQRHVVFWQVLPVIEFWAVLILIASFTAFFPLVYTLTDGGPGFATYTVDFDLYVEAFRTGELGYASAIGVSMLLIVATLSAITVSLLRWRRS